MLTQIRRIGLVAIVIAISRPDTRFNAPVVKQGQKASMSSTSELDLAMVTKSRGKEHRHDATIKTSVECSVMISKVEKNVVVGAKMEFGKCTREQPAAIGPAVLEYACSGKKYDLTRHGEAFEASGQTGTEERGTIASVCDAMVASPLVSVLQGKSLKVGDEVAVTAETGARLISSFWSSGTVRKVTLTLLDNEGDRATWARFKLAAEVFVPGNADSPSTMTLDISGDLFIDLTRLVMSSAALEGVATIGGSEGEGHEKTEYSGSGKARWKYSAKIE